MERNIHFTGLISSADKQLLDAYSSTVAGVVKKASQAVVHLKVLQKIQEPRTKMIVRNSL